MDGRPPGVPILSKNCGAVGVTGGRNARTSPSSVMGRREDDGTSSTATRRARGCGFSEQDRLHNGVRIRACV